MPHAELTDAGDLIALRTLWTEKEQVKLLPGSRWNADDKVWTVPATWAACKQLRGVFGAELTVGERLAAWSRGEHALRVAPALALRNLTTPSDENAELHDLYPFQRVGSDFLRVGGDVLLGDDTGLGKTPQVLDALERSGALPALVVCPNSVKLSWAEKAYRWAPSVVPFVVSGGAATRRKLIAEAAKLPKALVIINIEAVRGFSRLAPYGSVRLARCRECDRQRGEEGVTTSRCEVHRKELNGFGFRTVVLDEAHRIKDPSSKQTRAVWAVGHDPSVEVRWALTGTPIANHVGDLWSVLHFLDPVEHPTRSKFVDRYALQSWNAFGGLDVVGVNPHTRSEFFEVVDPRFRRMPKALVLDQLPAKVRSTRWVEMLPKQRRVYDELERQLFARVDSGLLVAPNQLVKATRLMQLAASYAEVEWVEVMEVRRTRRWLHTCGVCMHENIHSADCPARMRIVVKMIEPSPKLDALEDELEALGDKPVVVAAQSRQLIEMAGRRLASRRDCPVALLTGAQSDYERHEAVKRLQRGDVRAVLMTIDAGGTGTDGLQVADTLIVLQRSWKMLANIQLDGRVERIGSEVHESVHIIEVVTRDTIEERVLYPRLQEKLARLDEITRDRARLLAAGVTPDAMFTLDQEEALIVASDLGVPSE